MHDHQNSNNSGWIFFAGIATGAVLGYLLNTDRGREVREEYVEKARTGVQQSWETASSAVNTAIEKGKTYASDISSKLQNKVDDAADTASHKVDQAENAFQKGADRAKARLHDISAS